MGSWNNTCGLSNLHITSGTPVYVFVLEEKRDNSHCYSTSLFSPLLLPFESEYNDYGGGQNSSGVALPLILEGIEKCLVEMPLGENEYHDIEVTKEKFNEELFFEAVHEDRLKVQSRFSGDPTSIQFTMFRKDVVDAILEKRSIEKYVGNSKGTFGYNKNYIRYNFKDIVADIKPMIELIKTNIAKSEFEIRVFSGIDHMFDCECKNKAVQWLRYDSDYRYNRIVDMRIMIVDAFQSKDPDALAKLEELLEVRMKALFIERFMSDARKTWIPGGHEGSQSQSGAALRMLANVTIDILDKEKAAWLEEMGNEDEYTEE